MVGLGVGAAVETGDGADVGAGAATGVLGRHPMAETAPRITKPIRMALKVCLAV